MDLGSIGLLIVVSIHEPRISPSIVDPITVTPTTAARMVDGNLHYLHTKLNWRRPPRKFTKEIEDGAIQLSTLRWAWASATTTNSGSGSGCGTESE
ncbi:hypothetical protein HWV62_13497 [Athelia sp. TMB]|nr:hypothetical protein HWV62_13497 [Athelia sp. TMB]